MLAHSDARRREAGMLGMFMLDVLHGSLIHCKCRLIRPDFKTKLVVDTST